MVKRFLKCDCGAMVDTRSDAVRCKVCSKIHHLSCPLNKEYIIQSLRTPRIRILICNQCFSTTPIDEPIESSHRGTLNCSYTKIPPNKNDLENSLGSDGPDASSMPADFHDQSVSLIPAEQETFANLCKPSDAEGTKNNCGLCGNPVLRESKILECCECEKTYHYECAAYLPKQLQDLFEASGWTCVNCFICEEDLKREEDCRECKKTVLKKSKKLKCHRCSNVFHHECGSHANSLLKELVEKSRWLCRKCLTCNEKNQICSKCKTPVKKESKVLECNKCEKWFHYDCAKHAPKKVQEWFEKKGWICENCLVEVDHSKEQANGSTWTSIAIKATVGVGLTAACLVGIPWATGTLGLVAAAVSSSSLVAQSAVPAGIVASGGAIAAGASGLALSTQAGIAAVCTALPFLSELKKTKP